MASPQAPGDGPATVSWGSAVIVAAIATAFFVFVTVGLEFISRAICDCMP